jgi:hypothetical protein
MRRSIWAVIATGLLFCGATAARADVWDLDVNLEDDGSGTDNEVLHGTVQVHDILTQGGVADQDWYQVSSHAFASYEAVMEGLTGDLFQGVDLARVDGAGAVLTAGTIVPGGTVNQSVRWQNTTATPTQEFIRVAGSGTCGTTCDTNDQYTFRFFETSLSIARFNNSGSQVTILFLHNPASYTISGRVFYWNAAGTLITSQTFSAGPKALVSFATAGATGATSGAITITQDGRFGDLQAKSVALEPSTGFSFDTPGVYRNK